MCSPSILGLLFALISSLVRPSFASTKRDWCPLESSWNETTHAGEISKALAGQMLHVGVMHYPPFAMLDEKTGEWTGFDIELFKMVAQRGEFSFNITRLHHPEGEGETYNSILYSEGREFDVLATWWDETAARKRHGIGFSIPIVDMSFQLVTTNPRPHSPSFSDIDRFFLFLKPFSRDVWLVLLFSTLFTGMFLYCLEPSISDVAKGQYQKMRAGELRPESSWRRHTFGVMDLFHHGWLSWTGGGGYGPRKWYTKLYLMSWTGIILVMVAMYTSQLTFFLFVELQSTTSINSLEDLIASGKPVCAITDEDAVTRFLKLNAPSVPVYSIPILGEAFQSIRDGKCAAAILGEAEIEVELSINEACDMRAVGKLLNSLSGAYAADSNDCGLFPLVVVDSILQSMQESEEIEDLWETYTELPTECVGKLGSTQESTSTVITVTQIGGLFILHAGVAFVCLCGFVATWGAARIAQGKVGGGFTSPASVHPAHNPVILAVDPKKERESTDSSEASIDQKVATQEAWDRV